MDLFRFPFHADVWGTASEWLMIMVTSITAYFLYKTLQSQKEVQQTQNTLLEIEHVRLRKQFEVNLIYSEVQSADIPEHDRKNVISIAVLNRGENAAVNFSVKYPANKKVIPVTVKPNPKDLVRDKEYAYLHFMIKPEDKESIYGFEFYVYYTDQIGTKYRQEVEVLCDENQPNRIQVKLPLMVHHD